MAGNPVRNYLRRNYYGVKRGLSHISNTISDKSPKLLILAYHRIKENPGQDPLNTVVSTKSFIKQVERVSKDVRLISFADAVSQIKSGEVKRGLQAVISFDDGYADNFETAFPLLKKRGIPAAYFIPTYYIGRGCPVWDYEAIIRILYGNIDSIDAGGYSAVRGNKDTLAAFAFRIFDDLKSKGFATIDKVIAYLRENTPGCDLGGDRCMSWDEIKEMSDAGMEIGSHAVTHRSLARIPFSEALDEMASSKADIEQKTGRRCANFAFPFGSKRDYNGELVESVSRAGFDTCLLNIHGYNRMGKDAFALKRIIMEEHTETRFILG